MVVGEVGMAEILVNLDKVTVSLSGKVIFAELDWELQQEQRVGLVGPNGRASLRCLS